MDDWKLKTTPVVRLHRPMFVYVLLLAVKKSLYFFVVTGILLHDIDAIEKVQRRFTNLRLRRLKTYSYSEGLQYLGLPSLELRRLHLDLIFCYKIVFGIVNVSFSSFFKFSTVTSTRGHQYKLYKSHCSHSTHSRFFAERVINVWNCLPPSVDYSTLATFRRRYWRYWFYFVP